MLLSIIIVSYNTKELLEQCLDSIVSSLANGSPTTKKIKSPRVVSNNQEVSDQVLSLANLEVIVVDNNSTDGTREYLEALTAKKERPTTKETASLLSQNQFLKVKTIFNSENAGFARANNQGIKEAKGEYVLFLNSDTIILPLALQKMVAFMEENNQVAVLGPKLLNKDGTPQASVGTFPGLLIVFQMLFLERFLKNNRVRWSPNKAQEVDWVMGAALLAKKNIFEKIGYLDEKIFMYMEEVEWCYRVKNRNKKIFFYPDPKIIHLGQGSSKSGRKDPILNIYKGLIYFYQKHQSPNQLFLLKLALKIKAIFAYLAGLIGNNKYLKETYVEAIKIN